MSAHTKFVHTKDVVDECAHNIANAVINHTSAYLPTPNQGSEL